MYYRILSADENVRADEWFVKKDADTGITLVSRDTLPASDDGLQNKIVFDADGTLYRYDICGKPQIIGKTQKSINSIFRSQCRRTSAINEQSAWRTRKLSEVERTASVRYTRSEKYGHFLAFRFLFKEKWCDWMFQQHKDC